MKGVPVADVKARFADYVRRAEGGELCLVTRHGKPVVAIVPASDVELLKRLRAAGPDGGLASLAGGWKGSESLVHAIAKQHRTRPRKLPRI